jgi:tryptophanyl-tRNA synthetase
VTIFDAFAADNAARQAFHDELRAGLAWGEAKQRLVALIEGEIGPLRARYAELMAHPERIEEALQEGARKARAVATPFLAELRHAVGLRPMVAVAAPAKKATTAKVALPDFKQYREGGAFFFKLTSPQGAVLLQSAPIAEGREAGAWVKRLKAEGAAALEGAPVQWAASAERAQVEAALATLVAAQD